VHTWTFRNEQRRLVSDYAGNPVNDYLQFYRLGVDGLFLDFADTAVAARILFELERNPDGGAASPVIARGPHGTSRSATEVKRPANKACGRALVRPE